MKKKAIAIVSFFLSLSSLPFRSSSSSSLSPVCCRAQGLPDLDRHYREAPKRGRAERRLGDCAAAASRGTSSLLLASSSFELASFDCCCSRRGDAFASRGRSAKSCSLPSRLMMRRERRWNGRGIEPQKLQSIFRVFLLHSSEVIFRLLLSPFALFSRRKAFLFFRALFFFSLFFFTVSAHNVRRRPQDREGRRQVALGQARRTFWKRRELERGREKEKLSAAAAAIDTALSFFLLSRSRSLSLCLLRKRREDIRTKRAGER